MPHNPRRLTLLAESGADGWWYVRSPDAPGLIVTGPTLSEALGKVERAWRGLRAPPEEPRGG